MHVTTVRYPQHPAAYLLQSQFSPAGANPSEDRQQMAVQTLFKALDFARKWATAGGKFIDFYRLSYFS